MKERKLVCSVTCPNCEKPINIFKETDILVPAVKAEKTEEYVAEKNTQVTL